MYDHYQLTRNIYTDMYLMVKILVEITFHTKNIEHKT